MARSIVTRLNDIENKVEDVQALVVELAKAWGVDTPLADTPKLRSATKRGKHAAWSEDDEMKLMDMADNGKSYTACARALKRTDKACQIRVSLIRRHGRPWLA